MTYIMTFLIVAASSVLWRIRGGLFKEHIPVSYTHLTLPTKLEV